MVSDDDLFKVRDVAVDVAKECGAMIMKSMDEVREVEFKGTPGFRDVRRGRAGGRLASCRGRRAACLAALQHRRLTCATGACVVQVPTTW